MESTAPFLHASLLLLPDCEGVPLHQIGGRITHLLQLHRAHAPLPACCVVPVSFLEQIASHNKLYEKISPFLETADCADQKSIDHTSQQIQKIIQHLHWPDNLTTEFTTQYQAWMENKYVSVRPSLIAHQQPLTGTGELVVKGEANIVESVLRTWAHLYGPTHLELRKKEWLNHQYIPAAFLIQEMVEARAAGSAIGTNPHTGNTQRVMISAVWGIAKNSPEEEKYTNTFELDTKNWSILHHQTKVQTHQYVCQPEGLKSRPLPSNLHIRSALIDQEAITIAQLVHQLQQHWMSPQVVEWAIDKNNLLFVLNVSELRHVGAVHSAETHTIKSPTPERTTTNTALKLRLAISHLDELHQSCATDGIGLLESESIFLQLPEHPLTLIREGKREYVKAGIIHALYQSHAIDPALSIVYRSQNFTSAQMRMLGRESDHETAEENPYLGYRGSIRILHNFEFFDCEVEALVEAERHMRKPLSLMIPFVRTSTEIGIIKKHLAKKTDTYPLSERLWMECDTPENVLQLDQYLKQGLAGVSISVTNLHALLQGIDPQNTELENFYPYDVPLLKTLLKKAKDLRDATAPQTEIVLHLEQYTPELIEYVGEIGFTGITVSPKNITRTREILQRENGEMKSEGIKGFS